MQKVAHQKSVNPLPFVMMDHSQASQKVLSNFSKGNGTSERPLKFSLHGEPFIL